MSKLVKKLTIAAISLIAVGAILLVLASRASKVEPEFYTRALAVDESKHVEAGDQLEKRVLDLHNELRKEGFWEAAFTDEQINGWLAVDLPAKFPDAMPSTVSQPRVSISPELAHVACRYDGNKFSSVISMDVAVQATDEPNVLAVRIHRIRAGVLPVPAVEKWKGRIERIAMKVGLPLRWAKVDGDNVALIQVPMQHERFAGRQLRLETIRLAEGEVYLAGRTDDGSQGPVEVIHTASGRSDENTNRQ